MKVVITLLLILSGLSLFGQINEVKKDLFQLLEESLFPFDEGTIEISEIAECVEKFEGRSYQIRKNQPNPKAVLSILEMIGKVKKSSDTTQLLEIYKRQTDFFEMEWDSIFRTEFYVCDEAREQMKILEGFEVVLHSLYIKGFNWSASEIYEYYKNEIYLDYIHLENINQRKKLVEKRKIFSPTYKRWKAGAWFAYRVDFNCITPFLKDIEPYLIRDFEAFKFDTLRTDEAYKIESNFVRRTLPHLGEIDSKEVERVVIANFERWLNPYPLHIAMYRNFGESKNRDLIDFLLDNLFNNKSIAKLSISTQNTCFMGLLRNSNNQEYIEDYLLQALEEGEVEALKYLTYFPSESVFKRMKKIVRDRKSTIYEKKIVKYVLIQYRFRRNLPDELKKQHEQLSEKLSDLTPLSPYKKQQN